MPAAYLAYFPDSRRHRPLTGPEARRQRPHSGPRRPNAFFFLLFLTSDLFPPQSSALRTQPFPSPLPDIPGPRTIPVCSPDAQKAGLADLIGQEPTHKPHYWGDRS